MGIALTTCLLSPGCVDEAACHACITDQIELRQELRKQYPEDNLTVPSPAAARKACSHKIIAVSAPCAPRYWPLGLGVTMVLIPGIFYWIRKGRKKTRAPS